MMAPGTGAFSDLDDDILVAATPCNLTDEDSPRPVKRRRLQVIGNRDSIPRSSREDIGDSSDYSCADSTWPGNDSLTLPNQKPQPEFKPSSKRKIFVPRNGGAQEDTSASRPLSTPSRIRASDPKPQPVEQCHSGGGSESDENLQAAIAASLEHFEAEKSFQSLSSVPKPPIKSRSNDDYNQKFVVQTDATFDINDIPENAFDSSPSLSLSEEKNEPIIPPRTGSKQFPSKAQSLSQRGHLRQATLFGLAARDSTSLTKSCSPPDKEELPTHHKLDKEAMKTWVYPTNLGKIRDYQFNIAQRGLFHNLLVALPTGLGKTFIAATIMLNWFRWTKDSQIVFVAPTKPLVSQQVTACLNLAGIPRSQTSMLTGTASPGIRAEEWKAKRVFFMTPQTLVNDLKSGIADPKRIVFLVVDEAHRATGGYAYVEVVKFLRRFNSSFRILALTATPGSTVEAVQTVIDGLDISKVEIRTEESLDIREYVHSRNVETQTFTNSEDMLLCMDLLSKALQPSVDELRGLNAYWGRDPMSLTAYGLTKARQQWMGSGAGRNAGFGLRGKVNALFTVLASLAHAIDLLKYHGITSFYRHLLAFQSGKDGQKSGKYQRQIIEDDHFIELLNHIKPWISNEEFIGHPKLEYLRHVVLNHFMDAGEGRGYGDEPPSSNTRIMVFVHFRDSAEEVTRVLKRHGPMIRPHVFVGQASAKGSEGMDQKTQLSIVEKFKNGTFNTIVATSIGEEGLDIGEVDLIVCYDSSASPIRMLQRMGRTGRKRAGNIVLLLMQGKEEESYTKAKDNYEKMQQLIASGTRFTFHEDRSPRILPKGLKPEVDKRRVEIPQENLQQDLPAPKKRARPPRRPPKKFRMPDGVDSGFTKASCLHSGDIESLLEEKATKKLSIRPPGPTPEPVNIPSPEEVVLNETERRELEIRYRKVGGTTPQFVHPPRNDTFPHLQRVLRPTKLVKHGSMTRRMVKALQKMNTTKADCEDRHKGVLELVVQAAAARQSAHVPAVISRTAKKPAQISTTASRSNWTRMTANSERDTSEIAITDGERAAGARNPESPFSSPNHGGTQRSPISIDSPPPAEESLEQMPFYASQLSCLNDMDIDFEMPDIRTLVEGSINSDKE